MCFAKLVPPETLSNNWLLSLPWKSLYGAAGRRLSWLSARFTNARCQFNLWHPRRSQALWETEIGGALGNCWTDRQSSWIIRHQVRWETLSQKLMRRAREETSSQEHLASTCVCSSPFHACVQRHMVSCECVWLYVSTWMVESMDLRRCWHRN